MWKNDFKTVFNIYFVIFMHFSYGIAWFCRTKLLLAPPHGRFQLWRHNFYIEQYSGCTPLGQAYRVKSVPTCGIIPTRWPKYLHSPVRGALHSWGTEERGLKAQIQYGTKDWRCTEWDPQRGDHGTRSVTDVIFEF